MFSECACATKISVPLLVNAAKKNGQIRDIKLANDRRNRRNAMYVEPRTRLGDFFRTSVAEPSMMIWARPARTFPLSGVFALTPFLPGGNEMGDISGKIRRRRE